MNRIVLIGNGFDLAHGLKTSYANFIDWYWEYWGYRLLRGGNRTETDGLCSFIIRDSVDAPNWASVFQGWYYTRENPLKPWHLNDVINLAKEDKDLCDFTMSPFLERICKSIETKNWVDIENEYYELLKKYALEDNDEIKVEELNKQLHVLQERLVKYLGGIIVNKINIYEIIKKKIYSPFDNRDFSIEGQHAFYEHIMNAKSIVSSELKRKLGYYNILMDELYWNDFWKDIVKYYESIENDVKKIIIKEVPKELLLPNQILFLNFNYTNTARLYCKDAPIFNINQIHGMVDKFESVIFGYGDEMDDKYKELEKKNDNLCLGNIKSIKYLESDNYRKVLEFIEFEPYQVCIMGHSCGNSDRTLLNTLFEHRNCVSVKPYYYKKKDGMDNYLDLVQNISRNFNDKKLMRDRVVNKTFCQPLTEP